MGQLIKNLWESAGCSRQTHCCNKQISFICHDRQQPSGHRQSQQWLYCMPDRGGVGRNYPFHRQCGIICHLIYMHSYCALPNQSPPTPCVLSHFGNLSVEHTRIATHRIEHNIPQNTFHLIQGWTTLDTCIYEYMSQHANPDVPIVPVLFKESNIIVCVLLVSNSLGCCLARGETSGVVSPRRAITRAQPDNTRRV